MKPDNLYRLFFVTVVAVALLPACTTPSMTITFTDKACTYSGTASIPLGKFTVNWVVNDQIHNKTGLLIMTLAEGKTLADLQTTRTAEAPPWVTILWTDDENAFGSDLEKIRNYSHVHDLRTLANYHGEPLYMVCGNEIGMTNPLGPIEVTK
jgi:hypothetical protein